MFLLFRAVVKSYVYHEFLYFSRDLLSWINSIYALVSSEDLARDVAEAEAFQDRQQVRISILHVFIPRLSMPRLWSISSQSSMLKEGMSSRESVLKALYPMTAGMCY